MGSDSSKPLFFQGQESSYARCRDPDSSSDWLPDFDDSGPQCDTKVRRRAARRAYRPSSPFPPGTNLLEAVRDYLVAAKHADAPQDVQHLETSSGVAVFRCYRADIIERESDKKWPFWHKKDDLGWQCAPVPCHSILLFLTSESTQQQAAAFAVDGRRLTQHNVFESCGYGEFSVPDCISPAESFSEFDYRQAELNFILFRRETEFSSLQLHMQAMRANGARMHRDGVLCICKQMLVALEQLCQKPLESFTAPTILHPDTWLLRFCVVHFTDDMSPSGIANHYKQFCVVLDVFSSHQPAATSTSAQHHYCINAASSTSPSVIDVEQQRVFSTALVIAELVTGMSCSDIVSALSPSTFIWQHCSPDMLDLAAWICQALDHKNVCHVTTVEAFARAFHLFVAKDAEQNSTIFQWERYNPTIAAFEQLSAVDNQFLESRFVTRPPTLRGSLPHAGFAFDIEAPLLLPSALGLLMDTANDCAFALRRILIPTFRVQPRDFWMWQRLEDGHSWTACTPGDAAALEHARVFNQRDGDNSGLCDDNGSSTSSLRRITVAAARLCPVQIPYAFAVEPYCVKASAEDIERINNRVHSTLPEYVCPGIKHKPSFSLCVVRACMI